MQPKIEFNYQPKSSDPNRKCGVCSNFQPVAGSELDGRCFGAKVTTEGLCDYFNAKTN
jgi:hypothetical protein